MERSPTVLCETPVSKEMTFTLNSRHYLQIIKKTICNDSFVLVKRELVLTDNLVLQSTLGQRHSNPSCLFFLFCKVISLLQLTY